MKIQHGPATVTGDERHSNGHWLCAGKAVASRTIRKSGYLTCCKSMPSREGLWAVCESPAFDVEAGLFLMDSGCRKMKRLFLIRHGSTEQNDACRYFGVTDMPLSANGRHQAQLIADRLRSEHVIALFTSPLRRSLETAKVIAEPHQLEVETISGLREIDFGQWEGLTFDEIRSKNPDETSKWLKKPSTFVFPGGESVQEFRGRVLQALQDILNVSGTVVLVAHAGSLRIIICHLCGWPAKSFHSFVLDTASITVLERYDDTPIVKTLNDTCHLKTKR